MESLKSDEPVEEPAVELSQVSSDFEPGILDSSSGSLDEATRFLVNNPRANYYMPTQMGGNEDAGLPQIQHLHYNPLSLGQFMLQPISPMRFAPVQLLPVR